MQRSSVGGPRSAYGFAGEEQDPTSGQLFLRARTYNPSTGRFLQSDPVMGSPADPRTLHHYAYAFNNPVNYADPSGLWVGTLQRPREQRQNSPFQNLTNNYSAQSGTQLGYAGPAGRGGFNRAYMGQPGQASGIGSQRAATGPEARNWQPYSDPQPREQSQGHRPKVCGFTDILFGFGNSVLSGHILKDLFEFATHVPRLFGPMLSFSEKDMRQAIEAWANRCANTAMCLPSGAEDWLNNQVEQMVQMWQTADWRLAASMGYGAVMGLAVGALAASGVGLPIVLLAGAGAMAANTMFNAMLYNDWQNFGANLAGGGVEMAFGLAGGMIGGPAGWVIGSVIGAAFGQMTTNRLSGRPWDEGLLANMVFSGLAEGVGGAIGHSLGKWVGDGLDVPQRVLGPDGLGLLERYKWSKAGYDIKNPKIQNLIKAGYHPDDVIRLFRGQEMTYSEVLSPAARTHGVEYSQRMLEGELAARLRENEKAAMAAGVYPPDYDNDLNLILQAHKGNGTPPDSPFISMSKSEQRARQYATDTGVLLEIVIPKDKVLDVNERLGITVDSQKEAEFVIANQLPDEYIVKVTEMGSRKNICSFSADTSIVTEDGKKPISDLEIGDRVLAYDELMGTTNFYPVSEVWVHEDTIIEHLTIDGDRLKTTPEHPFYVWKGKWMPAGNLQIGDHIRKANGSYGVVEKIEFVYRSQSMYNLTIAKAHTYFVGNGQWLVHNSCPDIALGLGNYVNSFSASKGASTYERWMDDGVITMDDVRNNRSSNLGFFEFQLPTAMKNAQVVHFSLRGIEDIEKAIALGQRGSGYTNRELYLILHNKEWYDKTTFYDADGNVISLEFLGKK